MDVDWVVIEKDVFGVCVMYVVVQRMIQVQSMIKIDFMDQFCVDDLGVIECKVFD